MSHQFQDGTMADGSEPSLINTPVKNLDELKKKRRNILMREALKQEIQELADKSVEFKRTIDTAKTELKKEIFRKKLRRNNNKVFEMIDALNKIPAEQVEAANDSQV
jgi:hypothetical protein